MLIKEIVFRDGNKIMLGYDGVYNITIIPASGKDSTSFSVYYVEGEVLTVMEFDRYTSIKL